MVGGQVIPLSLRRHAAKRRAGTPNRPVAPHQRVSERRAAHTGLRRLEPLQRQIALRAINDHIRTISNRFASGEQVEFVCECARPGCLELVPLSPPTYEGIRRFGNRFFTKPGHADDEKRATADGHIVIVEKTGDEAAEAIRADPRREPSVFRRAGHTAYTEFWTDPHGSLADPNTSRTHY